MHWLSENQPTADDVQAAEEEAAAAQAALEAHTSPEGSIECTVKYILRGEGHLQMEWEFDARNALPATLAKGLSK